MNFQTMLNEIANADINVPAGVELDEASIDDIY